MAEEQKTGDEQNPKSGEQGSKFEGEFDASRATRLIENLREEVRTLKEERTSLKTEKQEREDAEKSEVDRLKDALTRSENETKEARRALHVSRAQAKHGLSDEEADEFLSGLDDEEKILARAERLAGLRGGSQVESGEESGEGEEESGEESGDLPSKPKPGLKPGSGAEADGDLDEDALVARARERRGY